jgi:primosomal protein N' (replication factor Y)
MPRYVRVAVNIAPINEPFDYQIPPALNEQIQPGSLVTVPFGRQMAQAIVLQEINEPSVPNLREITDLVDPLPVVTPLQLKLAEWMASETLSTLSECLDQMLPPGLSQHVDILVTLVNFPESSESLSLTQKRLLNALRERNPLRGRQLDTTLPHTHWRESLGVLVRQGWISTQPILLPPSIHARQIRTASLAMPLEQATARLRQPESGRKPQPVVLARRQAVLELLAHEGIPVNVSMIYAETGANAADIKTLAEQDMIALEESEFWRDPVEQMQHLELQSVPVLTPAQTAVWQSLQAQFEAPSSQNLNLLVGVTGSGKTEIYLHAVAETLAQGKGALILVPEISLTPQTVRRFYARFPGKVALIHSQLSPGERFDTWRRIRSGVLPVVVGPRSALFAPLPQPGLIVLDECHDESYVQADLRPHYSAVEAAIHYAQLAQAPLILGSATPDVEQLYRARREKWHELRLPERISSSAAPLPLPTVQIVDMRAEMKAGNRSVFSRRLREELEHTLAQNEQAILFLNRRGSATYVFCRDCGYVLRCPRCNTQLAFHASSSQLLCHICGYHRQMPQKCPECGSPNIRQFGLGTESLEKAVREEFPQANILRWDADTARVKGAHDLILEHFTQHRADILIGTKMLAKGLDLPLVTLVGVILADVSLNLPDFRAGERTFQLLSQVAGRAGRSSRGGKAIFQTFHPENYAIRYAALHDLDGFYEEELERRKKMIYPPFSRLLRIEFRHAQPGVVEQAAVATGNKFSAWAKELRLEMIGPVPCFYSRVAGISRWQILLKGSDFHPFLAQHPLSAWQPKDIGVELTVDPPSVL